MTKSSHGIRAPVNFLLELVAEARPEAREPETLAQLDQAEDDLMMQLFQK